MAGVIRAAALDAMNDTKGTFMDGAFLPTSKADTDKIYGEQYTKTLYDPLNNANGALSIYRSFFGTRGPPTGTDFSEHLLVLRPCDVWFWAAMSSTYGAGGTDVSVADQVLMWKFIRFKLRNYSADNTVFEPLFRTAFPTLLEPEEDLETMGLWVMLPDATLEDYTAFSDTFAAALYARSVR
jgi:hypothetical protein